ncbi:hypothetical protein TNCV_4671201 [Trichonephila clavipes]|nr:hypothetical protein TNCV_4671201 [Trichonephila clavipes]
MSTCFLTMASQCPSIVHCHDSQGWERSQSNLHHRESCWAKFQAQDFRSKSQENARLHLVHHPLPKSVSVEYLPFCMRGKFRQLARGNRGLMVVKEVWSNRKLI